MRLFKNLKARILKSIITWSEMGKQTAQAKEVYYRFVYRKKYHESDIRRSEECKTLRDSPF